ncbi:G1 family glutamic endopeptidase [Falsiroseomonas sp. HW251]|uniref:G1 family glutamic endopeptidase n=1 Tax=Falsiroseomonas sp. HW251 TaxID=3390998 RepID=UPI003D31E927
MLLDDAAAKAVVARLDDLVRVNRIRSVLGNDPVALLGDAAQDAAVVARWNALFANVGAQVPDVALQYIPAVEHRQRSDVSGASNTGADAWGGTRWGSSLNWSGVLIAAPGGGQFSTVSARWRLPARQEIRLPPGGNPNSPPAAGINSYKVSTWIGLDGHRSSSASLPQVGTTIVLDFRPGDPNCLPGTSFVVETYAWTQWWVKGKDSQPGYIEVPVPGFVVAPGETVTCWLTMPTPHEAFFRVVNDSTGAFWQKLWTNRPEDLQGMSVRVDRVKAPADGSAACFVVERPAVHRETAPQAVAPLVPPRNLLYPVPDFGAITLTECWARERRFGRPELLAGRVRDLGSRRVIRMFDRRPAPYRTAYCSVPAPAAEKDEVTVRYQAIA